MSNATNRPGKQRRYAPRVPREQRREQLLDAALHLAVRDGYDRVNIDAIAREAGVSRPVVYESFGGLDPLLDALLDRTQARAQASVLAVIPDDPATQGAAWLREAVASVLLAVQTDPDVWRPILGLIGPVPEFVGTRIAQTRELIHRQLCSALAAEPAPVDDPDVHAHLLMVGVEQLGRLALDDPDAYPRERLLAAIAPLLDRPEG